MHRFAPSEVIVPAVQMKKSLRARSGGFSLVEITLAIGIIAFAFVSLLGLLPVGLTTFRNAIDTGNEARIVQSFFSMILGSEFEAVRTKLDYDVSHTIYYFDEEGMPTDTTDKVVTSAIPNRLYGAKLFIEAPPAAPTRDGTIGNSVNAVVVLANIASPAKREFDEVTTLASLRKHIETVKGITDLKIRPMLVAKTDGFSGSL